MRENGQKVYFYATNRSKYSEEVKMENYLAGMIRAFGHKCEECRFYSDKHCSNPNWRGSKRSEIVHGDAKYMEPNTEACVLYRGKEEND